jgi:lipopolysaccharide/colanic/teichoic acid biosynthesis glycosyltransferase
MKNYQKIIKGILVILDIISFYLSIFILALVRYGLNIRELKIHIVGFSFILPLWIIIFHLNNFYEFNILRYKNYVSIIRGFASAFLISILFFYFVPYLKITPKTNLIFFTIYLFSIFLIFRKKFEDKFIKKETIKVLIIAPENLKEKIFEDFKNLTLYKIKNYLFEIPENKKDFEDVDLIIISRELKIHNGLDKLIKEVDFKIPIMELVDFYEQNFNRIILEEIDEYWILKNIINPEHRIQIFLKRVFDLFFSFILMIFLIILFPFIAIGILINSPGPIIFSQKRVGKDNKIFTLYKFRTMRGEKDLGVWAKEKDERIFFFGKILRRLHLDELPQVINILKNELSFVGPRPEQVNIVNDLEKKIKFFNIRHLILPGITGWAQVNYKYAGSIEESKIKLEYDLYYLKNKNIILDLLIIFKTIFSL